MKILDIRRRMYRDLLKTRPKNVSVWVVGKYTETWSRRRKSLNSIYGIRDLGTELSPITMLVMMESIQNGIVENGKRGKAPVRSRTNAQPWDVR